MSKDFSRRRFIKVGGTAAVALSGAALLAACGDSTPTTAPVATTAAATTAAAASATTAAAAATTAAAAATTAAAGATTAAAAGTTVASTGALIPVKTGFASTTMNFLPWFVAIDKGMFKQNGMDVTTQFIAAGSTIVRSLASNDTMFIATAMEEVVIANSQGADVVLVSAMNDQTPYTLWVQPEIKTVKDLAGGKKVAIYANASSAEIQMRYLLEQNGLKPMTDTLILPAGGNSERLAALKSKQVSATLLSPPTDLKAEAEGFVRLAYMKDIIKKYNHEVVATQGKLVRDNPALVKAFLKAQSEAIIWLKKPENKAEAIQIGIKWTKATLDEATKSYDFLLPMFPDTGALDVGAFDFALEAMVKNNYVDKAYKKEQVLKLDLVPGAK
jgi:NitT/TauT family transport system substrate-binding protein